LANFPAAAATPAQEEAEEINYKKAG